MATQQTPSASDAFYKQLGRMYGTYTGAFIAFIILCAVLEQVGTPNRVVGYLFVFFTLAVYAVIGIMTRTAQISEYYVAGRRVPAFYNGMATGADWMSAASFVGMAGSLFLQGYDGLAWVFGWTGGFVLVSILVGPYLRKFGAYTVPDFMAFRYGGNFARFLGVVVLCCCSFTYVTAQIYGTGIIASRFLGMQFEIAVFVGLVGILLCAMLGGMRAVTWTQIAQYIVLIVAYLTPIVILSTQKFGIPIPELTYGRAIAEIGAREAQMVKDGLATLCTAASCPPGSLKPHIEPFTTWTPLNFFGIIFCMMVGTASLPHILMRYFTTPSVREARQSVAWSLFFIFLLYFSAPAYAAFSKLEVYTNIIGRDVANIRPWMFQWGELGLIQVCGKNAANLQAVIDACKAIAGHPGVVRFQDFVINTDVIVLSTPEIAGLPYVISGLVAGRRSGGGAFHRRRAPARHRQRAEPRHLLQDARPQRADNSPAHGGSRALVLRGADRRLPRFDTTVGHPGDGRLGVLARDGRQLPRTGDGYLVEAHNHSRCDRRHHCRLRPLPVLSGGEPIFPGLRRQVCGYDLALEPDDRGADRQRGAGDDAAERHGGVSDARPSAGEQGRLVQPQQHQLRIVGAAAGLPRHLPRQPGDAGTLEGNASDGRRDPQAARPDGARRKT